MDAVVHPTIDLAQFVQRRELAAHEQRLARTAYAYGVDLRRSRWLADSTIGEALLRGVDRRWNELVESLHEQCRPATAQALPTHVIRELADIVKLLRGPLPSILVLRADVAGDWPICTPLGTTRGSMHGLVLDIETLVAQPSSVRRFLLGAAVGHLQCDHGPLFTAHLLAHRARRGVGLVRRALAPWSRVARFSADRAGLLACDNLEDALRGMGLAMSRAPAWRPAAPAPRLREQSLRDFERSYVVARVRGKLLETTEADAPDSDGADEPPTDNAAAPAAGDGGTATTDSAPAADAATSALPEYFSLARCDTRLTRRLGVY